MCLIMCMYMCSCLCVSALLEVEGQPLRCSSGSVYLDFEAESPGQATHWSPIITWYQLPGAEIRSTQDNACASVFQPWLLIGISTMSIWISWSLWWHADILLCDSICVQPDNSRGWVLATVGADWPSSNWGWGQVPFPVPVSYAGIFFCQSLTTVQNPIEVLLSALTLCYGLLRWLRVSHSEAQAGLSFSTLQFWCRHAQGPLAHSCLCWRPMLVNHHVCATISK